MNPDDQELTRELRRDEGVEYKPYKDTMGIWTVGVGHNMEAHPLPSDWTFPLTDEQVDRLLAQDVLDVFNDLDRVFPWWRNMSMVRQRVIANMCFNLGAPRLAGFKNTLAAMEQGRYTTAAAGMMASLWAKQVGKRAERLAEMMVNG
ncbi:MAG: glycoside hydrolase family protein [Pseudomonadota bacterium]